MLPHFPCSCYVAPWFSFGLSVCIGQCEKVCRVCFNFDCVKMVRFDVL